MFSELAKNDLIALRQQGFEPTDEEIIKLNDLGTQIEVGKDTTVANHPRFAYAGNIVFHEPTIGALEWWWSFGHDAAWTLKGQLHTHFFMLAHARDIGLLCTLQTPSAINKAVKIWLKGVNATDDEMLRAMLYVKHGTNWIMPTEETKEPDANERLDHICTLLAMVAGQVGIAPDSLKTQTETQLMQMLRYGSKAGMQLKPSIAKLYIQYQQTVRNIEDRGVKHGS